jgi:putative membrane protein
MKIVLAAACCIAICSIPAMAQKEGHAAMTDQQFVDFAAQTDMVEANLGQLAQTAGSAQDVKDYGKMLNTDHTNDFNQLAGIVSQANLKMPTAIDAAHDKEAITPMHKLNGSAFDQHYVAEMISGHTKAISIYKQEAASAKDAALKSYAQQTLPDLEKHLSEAQDVRKSEKK